VNKNAIRLPVSCSCISFLRVEFRLRAAPDVAPPSIPIPRNTEFKPKPRNFGVGAEFVSAIGQFACAAGRRLRGVVASTAGALATALLGLFGLP
jgi:hypothetical protein